MDSKAVYGFKVRWHDQCAEQLREYKMTFYDGAKGAPNEVSLFDVKNKRMFLKRTPVPHISSADLFIGAKVTIFARQLEICDYGDGATRSHFSAVRGSAVVVVRPSGYALLGPVLDAVYDGGYTVSKLRSFDPAAAADAVGMPEAAGDGGGTVVAIELIGGDPVAGFAQVVARNNWAGDVMCPASAEQSERWAAGLFGGPQRSTAVGDSCTCCVVKPHAVRNVGSVVRALMEGGFEVSAVQMFNLDRSQAKEFHEVYEGVVRPNEFTAMVDQLCSGPCIAMECRKEGAVAALRTLAGPADVEIAQALRPSTLRARFGDVQNKGWSGVHCTDLPEDGPLEVQYFFSILNNM